jgi:hypothetical protein
MQGDAELTRYGRDERFNGYDWLTSKWPPGSANDMWRYGEHADDPERSLKIQVSSIAPLAPTLGAWMRATDVGASKKLRMTTSSALRAGEYATPSRGVTPCGRSAWVLANKGVLQTTIAQFRSSRREASTRG